MNPSRSATLCTLSLALLLPLALPVTPAAAQEAETSIDFEAKRRELREQYKNASGPAEKRAILDEFRRLELAERGEDPNDPSHAARPDNLPTPADLAGITRELSVSNALGLGTNLSGDGSLDERDVSMLIGMAARDGLSKEDKEDIKELIDVFGDTMSDSSRKDLEGMLGDDAEFVLTTENKTWTSTYFPMAGSGMDDEGDPNDNLWAKNGALDLLDDVIERRTGKRGSNWETEKTSALNGLIGKKKGFWIPESTIREDDAERTTGVDFNGNGKIDPDVEHDFIDSRGNFGRDGKTDGTMNTGWWGRCNNVGIAGTLFKEPKHEVTLKGSDGKDVTFTPTMIKGLMAVYSDTIVNKGTEFHGERFWGDPDLVVLKDGTRINGDLVNGGEIPFRSDKATRTFNPNRRGDKDFLRVEGDDLEGKVKIRDMATGEEKEFEASEISWVGKEDSEQDMNANLFHNKLTEWLADGRGGVLEIDPDSEVWNYNVESAVIKETLERPWWAPENHTELEGWNGPAGSGEITYIETDIEYNGGKSKKNYRYWIEKDENGDIVNSGWSSKSADFMWRSREHEVDWSEPVPGLPDLDPKLIKELYEKSTGENPPTEDTHPGHAPREEPSRGGGGISGFFRSIARFFRNLFG